MSSPAAREFYRKKRTDIVLKFCKRNDFVLVPLNSGYQLRIENVLDVYPVNGRWCWLPTGERGDWNSYNDLRDIMLKQLPAQRPQFAPAGVEYTTREGFKTLAQSEQIMNVLSVPKPKRKWYQIWRRK